MLIQVGDSIVFPDKISISRQFAVSWGKVVFFLIDPEVLPMLMLALDLPSYQVAKPHQD